jgi:hypothetical protein
LAAIGLSTSVLVVRTRVWRTAWPVGAAALVLASAAGGGTAAFPAPAGRILVRAEEPISGFGLALVDLDGCRNRARRRPRCPRRRVVLARRP